MASDSTLSPPADRGMTPREFARYARLSPDRVRAMIASGELGAVNTAPARCGRPRYVILPHHIREDEIAVQEDHRGGVNQHESEQNQPAEGQVVGADAASRLGDLLVHLRTELRGNFFLIDNSGHVSTPY